MRLQAMKILNNKTYNKAINITRYAHLDAQRAARQLS